MGGFGEQGSEDPQVRCVRFLFFGPLDDDAAPRGRHVDITLHSKAFRDPTSALKALPYFQNRESRHPQYSSWTAAVVRCDETEQRGGNHWAGGCPFLEYGGYTWHLRYVADTRNLVWSIHTNISYPSLAKCIVYPCCPGHIETTFFRT